MPPAGHHPLKISPKELVFAGNIIDLIWLLRILTKHKAPLNRVITNTLKLHNVSPAPVAYKVKTTAPQRYCVRPNNGVLPPGETIEVQGTTLLNSFLFL